jgi:hypothetical protein
LKVLNNEESNYHLHIASKVTIYTSIQDQTTYGPGYISGRVDWALGYRTNKGELDSILVVVEAKKGGYTTSATSQALSYLAGAQDARRNSGKRNCDIFGILTDSKQFQFVVLRCDRRAYVSRPWWWVLEKNVIITFIDHILQKVIESSPHITPIKIANNHIMRYDQSFEFGTGEESITEYKDEEELYNVIEVGESPP